MIRPSASLLEEAVWANATAIVELMLEAGADPNLVNQTKKHSPLMQAAYDGRTSLVEMLLARGADVDLVAEHGSTALHSAIAGGHVDIVPVLLKAGADPELKGPQDGLSPLERAQMFSTDRWSGKDKREACKVISGVLEAAIAESERAQGSAT
jgi:ankyrin repeat protein